jgi:hypothetical protein
MRPVVAFGVRISFASTLVMMLSFSPNVRAQTSQSGAQNASQAACGAAAGATTAQNGSQNNGTLSAEGQNVKDAAKQIGSLFRKKPAASSSTSAAAAPSPCPAPAASASPANANANAPAPAAAPVAPATDTAPAVAASPSPAPQAPASGSALGGVQLPPVPPGGLDPSKLPDILGVHIGTPTDKVIPQLNSLYPFVRHGTGAEESGSGGNAFIKYAATNDPPYVSSTGFFKPNTAGCSPKGCQASDQMGAIFSGPPEKVAVKLFRTVTYDADNETTVDKMKAALVQKYGPNFTEYPPLTLNWAFDEQGNALPAPPKPVSCRGILSQQGYQGTTLVPGGPTTPNNPQRLDSYVGLLYNPGAPPLQQQLTPIMRGRCSYILVQAQINGQANGGANALTVTIQELPEDVRDAFAAEAYMQQAAKAQSNQQLNNAQQQAAPKF